MAKVRLDIETDYSQITSAFEPVDQQIAVARQGMKALANDSKQAFGTATGEAKKFEEEVEKGTDELNKMGKASDSLKKTPTVFKSLKAQIRELHNEAVKLRANGDLIGAERAIKHAAELKDQVDDVREAVATLAGNANQNLARGFGNATSLASQGFEGVLAIQSLVGAENENIQKQLLKLQAVQSISRIAREFADWKDRVTEIKLAFSPLIDLYAKGNQALLNFGKEGVASATVAGATNKNFIKTFAGDIKDLATSGIASFKALWATIIANPLAILLTAVGAIITALVVFREKIADLLGPFRAVLESIGLVSSAMEKQSRKIIEMSKLQEEAIERRYNHEIAMAEVAGKRVFELEQEKTKELQKSVLARYNALLFIFKKNQIFTEEELKEFIEVNKRKMELADQMTQHLAKQQQKERDTEKQIRKDIETLRIEAIKNDQRREEAMLKKKFNDEVDAASERIAGVFGTEAEQVAAMSPLVKAMEEKYQRDLAAIREKYAQKRKEENDRLLQLQREFQDAFNAIVKRANDGELERMHGEEKINRQAEIAIEELKALRENLIKRRQAIEDFEAKMKGRKPMAMGLTPEQQEEFNKLEKLIFQGQTDALVQLAADRANRVAEARLKASQQSEANLATEEGNLISSVNLQGKPVGSTEADFELAKQKAILDIQKDYAMKRLELKQASLRAERDAEETAMLAELATLKGRNDEDAQLRRIHINRSLELLDQKLAGENSKIQDETANLINSLQDQQNKLNQTKPFDLLKFLGITPEQFSNLQTTIGNIEQIVQGMLAAQLDAVNTQLQLSEIREQDAQRQVDNLQNQLEREIELGEEGKANNADRIVQAIAQEEEKVKREKELQQQALAEKKKIQQQQVLADTLTQASNIITASSQILATMAKDPVSLTLAFTAIGSMIAGFIAAKAAAFKAVESQNLKDGVVDLKGPGTETSDSIPANLSRGESVMTAKETRDNKKLLLGIRNKDKKLLTEGVIGLLTRDLVSPMNLLNDLLSGTGVKLPVDLPQELAGKRSVIEYHTLRQNNLVADFAEMKKGQMATNDRLDALVKQGSEKHYNDQHGNLVIKKGSHTIIKKK